MKLSGIKPQPSKVKFKSILAEYIEGHPQWLKIHTDIQGLVFFYNRSTNSSTWTMPPDLTVSSEEDGVDYVSEIRQNRLDSVKRRLVGQDLQEDENIKRPKIDHEENNTTIESIPDSESIENLSHEEKVTIFKEMLKSNKVAAFSTWEKELPKFAFDTRFTSRIKSDNFIDVSKFFLPQIGEQYSRAS